jgi:hypothetical protein
MMYRYMVSRMCHTVNCTKCLFYCIILMWHAETVFYITVCGACVYCKGYCTIIFGTYCTFVVPYSIWCLCVLYRILYNVQYLQFGTYCAFVVPYMVLLCIVKDIVPLLWHILYIFGTVYGACTVYCTEYCTVQ